MAQKLLKPESIMRAPWRYDVEPFRIADNLYYVGNSSVSTHLFDTGEGLLLLDTGYIQTAYMLFESIRKLGFDPADVRWILHTHGHYDHFGATRLFVEKYGCKTYLPEKDLSFLDKQPEMNCYPVYGFYYEAPHDLYFKVDVPVNPGDVLTFGNTKVEVFNAAGHTPGTVCYRFTLPSGLKAAMHGGIGINTLTKEYAAKHGLGETWRNNFVESLPKLKGLEVDIVLGNHPKQTDTMGKLSRRTPENNTFIDPTEWDRFLDKTMNNYLEKCT